MIIERKDPFTGKLNTLDLDVTQEQLDRWSSGELIQDVLPHLTPSELEFILTGITSDSFDVYLNESSEETVEVVLESPFEPYD